jgi:hypothetical protein
VAGLGTPLRYTLASMFKKVQFLISLSFHFSPIRKFPCKQSSYLTFQIKMQRPSNGYRGGIRVGHHHTHNHHISNEDDVNLSLSNSNSDEKDDIKPSPIYSSIGINNDFESAIRNLRPSATNEKKVKTNLNISKQKADLPQLNTTNGDQHNNSSHEQKPDENKLQDKQSRRWFPNPDIGHVDSDAFIRHNHVGKWNLI